MFVSTKRPSSKPCRIASPIVVLAPGKTVSDDTRVSVPSKLRIAMLPSFAFAATVAALSCILVILRASDIVSTALSPYTKNSLAAPVEY